MSEPVVSYPLREILAEMKKDIKATRDDVAELKTGSAVATARRAFWVAVLSPMMSAALILADLLSRHR